MNEKQSAKGHSDDEYFLNERVLYDIIEIILKIKGKKMVKAKKQEKTMEAALWEAANHLRGNVEPAEYKHVVLSLIFLKYASDKFEERKQELIQEGKSAYVEFVDFV